MCNELTLFVCNKYVLINTKTKKSLLSHSHQVEHVDLFDDGHEAVTATAVQHRLPERAFAHYANLIVPENGEQFFLIFVLFV